MRPVRNEASIAELQLGVQARASSHLVLLLVFRLAQVTPRFRSSFYIGRIEAQWTCCVKLRPRIAGSRMSNQSNKYQMFYDLEAKNLPTDFLAKNSAYLNLHEAICDRWNGIWSMELPTRENRLPLICFTFRLLQAVSSGVCGDAASKGKHIAFEKCVGDIKDFGNIAPIVSPERI